MDYDELERRQGLVDGMSGASQVEYFESLNRVSRVFHGNILELEQQVGRFTGTDAMIDDLGDDYQHETNRIFHNFLAAVGTMRDIQRKVHGKVWPAPPEKGAQSEWEKKVYGPKAAKVFGTPESKFVQDLRNYNLHYDLPTVSGTTNVSWQRDAYMVQTNTLALSKEKLLRYQKWSAAAKTFLEAHDESVDFLPAIAAYTLSVREFFAWFWHTVRAELDPGFSDFEFSFTECALWQSEDMRWGEWRMSIHSDTDGQIAAAKHVYAKAKLDRWAHGSRGWRVFQCEQNGQPEQIGDDPWGLPPRSH